MTLATDRTPSDRSARALLAWLACALLAIALMAPAVAGARGGGSSGHSSSGGGSSSHSSSSGGSSSHSSSGGSHITHIAPSHIHSRSFCLRNPSACYAGAGVAGYPYYYHRRPSTAAGIGLGLILGIIFGGFGLVIAIIVLAFVLLGRAGRRGGGGGAPIVTAAAPGAGGAQWKGPGWNVPSADTRAELKRVAEARQAATMADPDDGYWDPDELEKRFREVWGKAQSAWSAGDLTPARDVMSDALFQRWQMQLEGMRRQGRVNRVTDLKLDAVHLVRIYNVTDDSEDRFVVHVRGMARDWIEDGSGTFVSGSKDLQGFSEYWTFARHPQYGWVVDEIQQEEEGRYHLAEKDVNQDEGPATFERSDA